MSMAKTKTAHENYYVIGLNQLPVTAVTGNDALKVLGSHNTSSKVDIEQAMENIKRDKKRVKTWAKAHVQSKIIDEARKRNILVKGEVVVNIPNLCESWATDGSIENGKKIWYVLFGCFDTHHNWEGELEEKFMTEFKWMYKDIPEDANKRSRRQKGCVAKIISSAKNEIVKLVNEAVSAEKMHGRVITITRPTNLVKQAPDKRRIRGCFYDWCIREADGSIAMDEAPLLPLKESSKKKKSKAKQKTEGVCEPRNDRKPAVDAEARVDATLADEASVTPMRTSSGIKSKCGGMTTSSECTYIHCADATTADSSSSDTEDGENAKVTKQKRAKINQGVSKLLMVHYDNSSVSTNQLFCSYSTSLRIPANLFWSTHTY